MDLFDYMREQNMEKEAPLASRLRPTTLEEVVGQQHIIGKDKLLYRAIKADKLSSVIFYGPPGTGKTTLAKVIANTTSAEFTQINATTAGKKDMEEVIARAKEMKPSVLFLSYGMNDVGAQNGDADGFIKAYRPVIRDLKKSLPDTKIYVNSILPAAQTAIDQNSVYAEIPKFNQKLKKLCEKEKVTFIDNTDLVKQEYYAGDGIHMSTGYYKEWVNHMAEVAEL